MSEKQKKKFEDILNHALDTWCAENSNMIVRNTKIDGDMYGLGMKTDIQDYFNEISLTKNVGRFA